MNLFTHYYFKVKDLLLLFFVCCFGITIAQTNSLVVMHHKGNSFQLKIDGISINKKDEAIVKATGLSAGKHIIEIWQMDNGKESIYKDSVTIGKDEKFNNKEFTFAITQEKNNRQVLQFKSVSELSGPVTPLIPNAPKEQAPLVDNSVYGNLYKAINNKPEFFNHYQSTTNLCDINLSDKDLEFAKQLISKCNDPEKQYRYLTEITEKNCYSCTQYLQLLELMPMDIDKLSASKLAYSHLRDKKNVAIISNSFKYPSMKETFMQYVKTEELQQKQIAKKCTEPIENTKFNAFVLSLKQLNSEYDKWKQSKAFVLINCIDCQQAKEITNTFLHDREKLDFLKATFTSLTDKANASNLVSELQAASDKEEYLQFITKP